MKKFFAVLMTFVMAFILVGCKKTPTLTFEVTSYNMNVGDEVTLNPTITNLEGEDLVSYKVNGQGIIEVKGSKVTALKEGEATIEVTLKDYEKVPSVTLTITVKKVAVTDVKIGGEKQVRKGESITLTAVVEPEKATYKDVTWATADEKIATVDATGKVTGVEAGKVKISATADGVKKEVEIEVLKPLATAIKLTGEATMIMGAKQTLKVELTPVDAVNEVTFKSSKEDIATVDKDGVVNAIKPGEVEITATVNGKEAKLAIVVVRPAVEKIEIAGNANVKPGQTIKLTATVTPADAVQTIAWSSNNEEVATVAEDGTVSAVKPGKATITAAGADDKKATVEVVVDFADTESVTISGEATLLEGETIALTAKVAPEMANPAITWTSSDDTIATVTEDGKVTGVKPGEVTITAAGANDKKAELKVTVQYHLETILVDAKYDENTKFEGLDHTYKLGVNAFKTITEAIEAAPKGATIKVAAGTYAEEIAINKSVKLEGANKGINPNTGKRVEETILTGVATITASDVSLDGFAITGNGYVTTVSQVFNLEFVNINAYGKEPVAAWTNKSNYDKTAVLNIVGNDNSKLITNVTIADSKFDVKCEAIKLGRTADVTIKDNVFTNFERDAIKQSGGYNGGTLLIANNQFVNETVKGYNGIYFAMYGDNSAKADAKIIVKENLFKNIGFAGEMYSGAMAAKGYQESGANFLFEENVVENCLNGFLIRSNATQANHEANKWALTARLNKFVNVAGKIFECRFTSGDTDATTPAVAVFDKNLYLDAEGKIIDATSKVLHVKENTNAYTTVKAYEDEIRGIKVNYNIVVDGNWATMEDGAKVNVFGVEYTIGTNAFGTLAKAAAAAKENDIIYVLPGSYAEDVTFAKAVTLVGNYKLEKANYTGVMTIGSNTTIDSITFEGKGQLVLNGEGNVENVTLTRNTFNNVSIADGSQGYVYAKAPLVNFVLTDNVVNNALVARFVRTAKTVTDITVENNKFNDTSAMYDWIRTDGAIGGNVVFKGNYFGESNQSALMLMNHTPGNFKFIDNVFNKISNVAIDLRELKGDENSKSTVEIIHNVFDHTDAKFNPWGCLRLRFAGYKAENLKVNVNYNTFIGWGLVDVIENAGKVKYDGKIVNADYNYIEGVDRNTIDAKAEEIFGKIGLSWENTFSTPEAVEAAYANKATKIEFEEAEIKVSEGNEIKLNVKTTPAEACKEFKYSVDKEGIVEIDLNGNLKALKQGTVKVTVTTMDGSNLTAEVTVTVTKFYGYMIGEEKYFKMEDAIEAAKEGDTIKLCGAVETVDFEFTKKNLHFVGVTEGYEKSVITGYIIAPNGTTYENITFTGKGKLTFKDATLVENVAIKNCVFDNIVYGRADHGYIFFDGAVKGAVIEGNKAINVDTYRLIRFPKMAENVKIINNDFSSATTTLTDYLYADAGMKGELLVKGNKFGFAAQSAFMIRKHSAGNFTFEDNYFGDITNTVIDIRELVGEDMHYTLKIRHNVFESTKAADPWGCIRIRYGKYTDLTNLKVDINYNVFKGWKKAIIDNCGAPEFNKQIVNFDNNFVEGVTAGTVEVLNKDYCGNILTSANGMFDTAEALEAAYKALPQA